MALAWEYKNEFVCLRESHTQCMRLESCKSTLHIKHTTAFFAFVLFMYPVGMVIYKGFFNSCHLFINGL